MFVVNILFFLFIFLRLYYSKIVCYVPVFTIALIFVNDLYAIEFNEIALRQFLFPRLFYNEFQLNSFIL